MIIIVIMIILIVISTCICQPLSALLILTHLNLKQHHKVGTTTISSLETRKRRHKG